MIYSVTRGVVDQQRADFRLDYKSSEDLARLAAHFDKTAPNATGLNRRDAEAFAIACRQILAERNAEQA